MYVCVCVKKYLETIGKIEIYILHLCKDLFLYRTENLFLVFRPFLPNNKREALRHKGFVPVLTS